MKRSELLVKPMRCVYCGKRLTIFNTHIDHIVPKSKGGSDSPENKLPICATCNRRKHDRPPIKFLREIFRKSGVKIDWNLEEQNKPNIAGTLDVPTVKFYGDDWYYYKVGQQWHVRLIRRTKKEAELLLDADLKFLAVIARWDKTVVDGLINWLERQLDKGMGNDLTPFMNKTENNKGEEKGALLGRF